MWFFVSDLVLQWNWAIAQFCWWFSLFKTEGSKDGKHHYIVTVHPNYWKYLFSYIRRSESKWINEPIRQALKQPSQTRFGKPSFIDCLHKLSIYISILGIKAPRLPKQRYSCWTGCFFNSVGSKFSPNSPIHFHSFVVIRSQSVKWQKLLELT